LLYISTQAKAAHPDTKPTYFFVGVMDEAGRWLEDANISVSLFQEGGVRKYIEGFSAQTKLLAIDTHSLGIATIRVEMDGFYTHLEKLVLKSNSDQRRYEPWGHKYVIALKKEVNPRELYVHRVNWLPVPVFDKPVGYDLEKADWVIPFGTGVHSDFIFTLSRTLSAGIEYDGTMSLTFSNRFDGLLPVISMGGSKSSLLLGRDAPLNGYAAEYKRKVGVVKNGNEFRLSDEPTRELLETYDGIWFRVRSEVDATTGDLKNARYGKLDGFIDFAVREQDGPGYIKFVYYLAPDSSRSLEYNGKSLVPNADLQGVNKK
jgi:hypothetical protein